MSHSPLELIAKRNRQVVVLIGFTTFLTFYSDCIVLLHNKECTSSVHLYCALNYISRYTA